MDIASSLLCDGQDSRLYRRLVERDQIARDVSCSQMTRRLGGMFLIEATAAEGHTTDEIVAAVDSELGHVLGDAPPTAEEVSSAVTSYKVGAYYGLQTIQGKASTMSGYMDLLGKPDAVQDDLNRYLKLKPSKVLKVLKALKLVLDAPRVELHVLPQADAPAGGAP
jgi:zinc protease